jgi:Immunity protein 35
MPSLNRDSATLLARERIDRLAQAMKDQFQIASTKEIEQGWLFFYNTADFLRTRDFSHALAGNGPILVTREGVVHQLPSAIPWEDAVKQI